MSMTFEAIYESGTLRPVVPVDLTEGMLLDVTVSPKHFVAPKAVLHLPDPTPEEAAYSQRVRTAKTLSELFEIMKSAPPLPAGYDLDAAIKANRMSIPERFHLSDKE